MSGYGCGAAGVAFAACRMSEVRQTPAMCRRRLTLLRLIAVGSGEEGAGGAFAVGDDQLGDVALIEAVAQAPRTLRARSRATQGC
jgi:hypothetical protein